MRGSLRAWCSEVLASISVGFLAIYLSQWQITFWPLILTFLHPDDTVLEPPKNHLYEDTICTSRY